MSGDLGADHKISIQTAQSTVFGLQNSIYQRAGSGSGVRNNYKELIQKLVAFVGRLYSTLDVDAWAATAGTLTRAIFKTIVVHASEIMRDAISLGLVSFAYLTILKTTISTKIQPTRGSEK